ncbi:IS4 family transposase [Desulfosarcina ovata]|uniref:Transposase IS4-like domain-containing protein n=1 Tax=Desulfosarcina ovata subsp. ovata TaxID=2752305 RepID=A0A5K8AFC0_9BACT|nr:IS4 family transposase [Desulfosarcina ovata]BBO90634.1 hypothetical protein DSCOOX_38140 [Desulfosarcina ovata subsp. ovata]
MSEHIDKNVFQTILSPVLPLIEVNQNSLHNDLDTYKLSLSSFTTNLLFGIITRIKSVGQIVTEIKTSPTAKALGLVVASKSMYNEAFNRYPPEIFKDIFHQLVKELDLHKIPEISHLGKMLIVDGSLFPAISNMAWACYKKTANAIKMHLSFELNRMIPTEFISTEGNFSEKEFVKQILREGITYVCDRGYIAFNLFKQISDSNAFFIIRGKSNMTYTVKECLTATVPDTFLKFFSDITDSNIIFNSDENKASYRIVSFTAMGENYILITNRNDLTTYEIIMLYAYRWQVELFFRFIKRTFKGIHLMSQSPHGVQIQFYLYMIAYLLLLSFKQDTEIISRENEKDEHESEENNKNEALLTSSSCSNSNAKRPYVCGLVTLLGEKLKQFYKIGLHWLLAVKNNLLEIFDVNIAKVIAQYSYQ